MCEFSFAFDDTEEFGIGGQVGDDIIGLAASTDLSHFYNHRTALTYNRAMLNEIECFHPEGAFDVERAGKGFACGLGAFTAVMWASRELGADKVQVLRHAISGDVTGDYSSVVGYAAAVVLRGHNMCRH